MNIEEADSSASTISLLLRLARSEPNSSKIKNFIASTNEAFKAAYAPAQPRTELINPIKLARQVHYYALVISKSNTAGEQTHARPRWKSCAEAYNRDFFEKHADPQIGLPSNIEDEDLATLLTTNRLGSRTTNLYAALALFLVDLHERGMLSSSYMRMLLPASELSYVQELRDYIRTVAKRIEQGVDLPFAAAGDVTEISVHFYVNTAKTKDLERFHARFREDSDSCSHFICYRPRMSEPRELMKSFIAIKPPEAKKPDSLPASNSFNFVHIYSPPQSDNKNRISMGRVLPLDEGLYLVGGQRHRTEKRTPFKTLKVIALPWTAVNRWDALLPCLVMSANNDMQHIVSRAAIRATPILHSGELRLGSVKLSDLAADIAADNALEAKLLGERGASNEGFSRYGLSRQGNDANNGRSFAADILDMVNNNPTRWDLATRYDREPSSKEGVRILTATAIEQELERSFGSDSDARYRNASGSIFDFWDSIRFGALARQ